METEFNFRGRVCQIPASLPKFELVDVRKETSSHQTLIPTFLWIDKYLMVTKQDFLETEREMEVSLSVGCLPYAVEMQPSITLNYLERKWILRWWGQWNYTWTTQLLQMELVQLSINTWMSLDETCISFSSIDLIETITFKNPTKIFTKLCLSSRVMLELH